MRFLSSWSAALLALALLLPAGAGLGPDAPRRVLDDALAVEVRGAPGTWHAALVSVPAPAGPADVAALRELGLRVARVYEPFGVLLVEGKGSDLARLEGTPRVTHATGLDPITFHSDTGTIATRAREAWDQSRSTSTNPVVVNGRVLDGTGVGIALVDSGVDSTHPDLAPAVAVNKKFVCPTPFLVHGTSQTCYGAFVAGGFLNGFDPPLLPPPGHAVTGGDPVTGCSNFPWADAPHTDSSSGHGTHTAGIALGRGVASDGRFMGAAPGASLYAFGTGEVINILYPLEAFNWILCHHANVTPPIRVVSNSWGVDGPAWDPDDPINQAVTALAQAGLVVTFSAGNAGGDGSQNNVNTYAKNPSPGVLGVASYNDQGTGTRAGALSGFSSRGDASEADRNNWPDVSAPGDTIISTLTATGSIIAIGVAPTYLPWYAASSGTSMAAPHVAGIAALLFQANPALTPGDVEDILEDHAVPYATAGGYVLDASNPTTGINYGAGHGLVDAIAALEDPRVLGGSGLGSRLVQTSMAPHVYFQGVDGGSFVGGVPGVAPLQWTEPAGQTVLLSERSLTSGNTALFPYSVGQAARFRLTAPDASVTFLASSVAADPNGGFRVNANVAFPTAGAWVVEPQVNFGSPPTPPLEGFRAIDRFVVHVV